MSVMKNFVHLALWAFFVCVLVFVHVCLCVWWRTGGGGGVVFQFIHSFDVYLVLRSHFR